MDYFYYGVILIYRSGIRRREELRTYRICVGPPLLRLKLIIQGLREGAKFMGNPGRVYLQGGRPFFGKKKKGARTFFRQKKGGQVLFLP